MTQETIIESSSGEKVTKITSPNWLHNYDNGALTVQVSKLDDSFYLTEADGFIGNVDQSHLDMLQTFVDTQFESYPVIEIKLLNNVHGFPPKEYRTGMLNYYKRNQGKIAGVIFVNAPFHLNMTLKAAGLVYRGSIKKAVATSLEDAIAIGHKILAGRTSSILPGSPNSLEHNSGHFIHVVEEDIMAVSNYIASTIWDTNDHSYKEDLPLPDDHPLTPILEAFVVAHNETVQLKGALKAEKAKRLSDEVIINPEIAPDRDNNGDGVVVS